MPIGAYLTCRVVWTAYSAVRLTQRVRSALQIYSLQHSYGSSIHIQQLQANPIVESAVLLNSPPHVKHASLGRRFAVSPAAAPPQRHLERTVLVLLTPHPRKLAPRCLNQT
jgi:hypothetical protein